MRGVEERKAIVKKGEGTEMKARGRALMLN